MNTTVTGATKRSLVEQQPGGRPHREIADQYTGQACTLEMDGKSYDAVILRSYYGNFAVISTAAMYRLPVQGFSWQAVEQVMEGDKIFQA